MLSAGPTATASSASSELHYFPEWHRQPLSGNRRAWPVLVLLATCGKERGQARPRFYFMGAMPVCVPGKSKKYMMIEMVYTFTYGRTALTDPSPDEVQRNSGPSQRTLLSQCPGLFLLLSLTQ